MAIEDFIDNPYVLETNDPTGVEVVRLDSGAKKIKSRFYFFMAAAPITGGDLVVVQHAKALIEAGVDARFLYLPNRQQGTKISDFPPEVPLNLLDHRICMTPFDFLVTGESQGPVYQDMSSWLKGNPDFPKMIMLNQAVHWMAYAFDCPNAINNCRMAGMISAAQFITDYAKNDLKIELDKVFDEVVNIFPITELPQEILAYPDSLSRSNSKKSPKCRIAYIKNFRKRFCESNFLLFSFLSLYPKYQDKVEIVEIHKMTHNEVLKSLRSSDIFLATGYMDSHNLTATEAMAAGCHVVGYTGILYENSYFNDENSWWFKKEGENLRHIAIIKEAVDLYFATNKENKAKRQRIITNAVNSIAENFSSSSPNTQIVDGYRKIWEKVIPDKNYACFSCKNKGYFINP